MTMTDELHAMTITPQPPARMAEIRRRPDRRCEQCAWWINVTYVNGYRDRGACRGMPPQIEATAGSMSLSSWPVTHHMHFCSLWTDRAGHQDFEIKE
jgi:hypothetical protein